MAAVRDLQRLVRDRLAELDLSYRRAAARSHGLVQHATLQRVAAGEHTGRFEDSTLTGIALALDLPESEVRKAAGRAAVQPGRQVILPPRFNNLSPSDRKVLITVADALLAKSEPTVARTRSKRRHTDG